MVCVFVCVQVRRGPLQTLIRVFNPSLPSSPQPPEQRVGGNGYWFFLFIILSLDDFSLAVDNIFSLSLFILFFYLLTYLEADQMLLSELSRVFILRECAWVRTQARITEREAEYLHEMNTKYTIIPLGWCFYPKYVTICLTPNDTALWENQKLLTDANNFLDLDTGGVDLFGELTDSLVRVLVGKGVNVYPHSWRKKFGKEREEGGEGRKEGSEKKKYGSERVKVNSFWQLHSICSLFPSCCRLHRLPLEPLLLLLLSSLQTLLLYLPCFSCRCGRLRWRRSSLAWNFCGTQIKNADDLIMRCLEHEAASTLTSKLFFFFAPFYGLHLRFRVHAHEHTWQR